MKREILFPTTDPHMVEYCLDKEYRILIKEGMHYCYIPKTDVCSLIYKFEEWKDNKK